MTNSEPPLDPDRQSGMIGFKTAMLLFVVLAIAAVATLKGAALIFALLIVGALAVKAYTHHLRERISANEQRNPSSGIQ
jgi:hypothetical protein